MPNVAELLERESETVDREPDGFERLTTDATGHGATNGSARGSSLSWYR